MKKLITLILIGMFASCEKEALTSEPIYKDFTEAEMMEEAEKMGLALSRSAKQAIDTCFIEFVDLEALTWGGDQFPVYYSFNESGYKAQLAFAGWLISEYPNATITIGPNQDVDNSVNASPYGDCSATCTHVIAQGLVGLEVWASWFWYQEDITK